MPTNRELVRRHMVRECSFLRSCFEGDKVTTKIGNADASKIDVLLKIFHQILIGSIPLRKSCNKSLIEKNLKDKFINDFGHNFKKNLKTLPLSEKKKLIEPFINCLRDILHPIFVRVE